MPAKEQAPGSDDGCPSGSDSVTVELIGPAGVGKSFLCERLLGEARAAGIPLRDFNSLPVNKMAPRTVAMLLEAIVLAFRTQPKSVAWMIRASRVIARYSIRRDICSRLPGASITSEGIFHRIISLHRNSRTLGMIDVAELLLERIPPPDVVVIAEAAEETVFARRSYRNRINDYFCTASVKADIEITRRSVRVIEHVRASLYPQMLILRVSNDEEGGGGAVGQVLSAIERLTDSRKIAADGA